MAPVPGMLPACPACCLLMTQPRWPATLVRLNTLVCRKHPQKNSSSFKPRMEVKAGGLRARRKPCYHTRVETTHKYRSRKHNEDKPWAFPCVLSFGSQFHEALESCAALYSISIYGALTRSQVLTGLFCLIQQTSAEHLQRTRALPKRKDSCLKAAFWAVCYLYSVQYPCFHRFLNAYSRSSLVY